MRRIALAALVLVVAATVTATLQTAAPPRARAAATRVLDLGHPLAESDPTWTGEKVFTRTVVATIAKDGYAAGRITTEEHFGTHFDAPAHFGGTWTVDQVPVERLVDRPGVCINVSLEARASEDYRLSLKD